MKTDEPALVDTNVLVYATNPSSPYHLSSRNLWERGLNGKIPLCTCPQILVEFFSTVTNPNRFEPPRSPQEAVQEIRKYLESSVTMIFPQLDVMDRILELVESHPIRAQGIFDLQLVATMLTNGITRIYTYNADHFRPFPEIEVFTPETRGRHEGQI